MIEAGDVFDFCYLDGGHTWAVTGFHFFLMEHLIAPGGWLLFDDIRWSFATSTHKNKAWVQNLTEEERTTCQVGKVWELLVKPHPGFFNFNEQHNWAWCQKRL